MLEFLKHLFGPLLKEAALHLTGKRRCEHIAGGGKTGVEICSQEPSGNYVGSGVLLIFATISPALADLRGDRGAELGGVHFGCLRELLTKESGKAQFVRGCLMFVEEGKLLFANDHRGFAYFPDSPPGYAKAPISSCFLGSLKYTSKPSSADPPLKSVNFDRPPFALFGPQC